MTSQCSKTTQTPDWTLVKTGADWFGDSEKELRQFVAENAKKFAGDALDSLSSEKTGHPIPDGTDLERASESVNRSILDLVRDESFLSKIQIGGSDATNLRQELDTLLPPMELPMPIKTKSEVKPVAAGLFAVAGAVLGMFAVAGICRLMLGTQNEGILFGAAGGAFLFTWGLMHVAKSDTLQNWITGTLGFLTLAEVATQIGRLWFPPLSWLTNRTGGSASSFKRIAAYLAIIVLVRVTRCKDEFDADRYRPVLESRIRHQLDFALSIIAVLGQIVKRIQTETPKESSQNERTLGKVAGAAKEFKRAQSLREIDDCISVLIQELRNGGYEIDKPDSKLFDTPGGEEKPVAIPRSEVLRWTEEMREKYETFGLIEEGDTVAIMEEPLVQNGVVTKKGQVKKTKRGM